MRTIRSSVFETNSSSSHSITIDQTNCLPIIEDGVLYLPRLKPYLVEFEDSYVLIADTFEKKLAFVISSFLIRDDEYDQLTTTYIEKLKEEYGIRIDINYNSDDLVCIYDENNEFPTDINELIFLINDSKIRLTYSKNDW